MKPERIAQLRQAVHDKCYLVDHWAVLAECLDVIEKQQQTIKVIEVTCDLHRRTEASELYRS